MTRSTRKQPFCWQEKKITRLIRANFNKSKLVKMLLLYQTITEIDSDFNGKDIKFYTKTISTYSGLSVEFIPKGLLWLQENNVLQVIEERIKGRHKGKRLVFTPEKVAETPQKPVTGKTINGKPVTGKTDTSEDSSFKEDSSLLEESKQTPKEKRLSELKKRIGTKQFNFIKSANYEDLRRLGEKFELAIKYLEYRNEIKKPFKTLNGIKQKVIKPFLENQLQKVSRVVKYAIDEEYLQLNWLEDWKGQKNYKQNGFEKPIVLKAAPSSFTSPSSI